MTVFNSLVDRSSLSQEIHPAIHAEGSWILLSVLSTEPNSALKPLALKPSRGKPKRGYNDSGTKILNYTELHRRPMER
jgi:hypothetical protein